MGLFREAGRRLERLRQQAEEAAREEATHVCGDCEELLYAASDECPHCGSAAVRERTGDDG